MLLRAGPLSYDLDQGRHLFGGVVVTLEEAELVVLEGPSGAGKSTLLRCVAGLSGAVEARRELAGTSFAGRDLQNWRARVTLLAQDAPMLPGSVSENLAFPYRHRVADRPAPDADSIREEMERCGLGDMDLDQPVDSLSGGERHRLALVRAMLWDPPVVLADEPFSGLDRDRAESCFERLAQFARQPGHAALVVQHDAAIRSRADRVTTLEGLERAS